MGMGSIIINCARGGVIEEKTLFRALKDKKIFYAGLDVFENEPDINFAVSHLDNALLTPHIAGKTKESYKRMAVQAAETLIKNF
jgi:D-3-phosphoglycerate dehydrogenase